MNRIRNRWNAWKQRRRLARQETWFGLGSCGCVVAWMLAEPNEDEPLFTDEVMTTLECGMEVPIAWIKIRGVDHNLTDKLSALHNHIMIEGESRVQKSAHGGVVTTKYPDQLGGPETCSRGPATIRARSLYLPGVKK